MVFNIVKREMKSVLWKENAYINQIMQKMRIGNYCGLFVMNERQKTIRGVVNKKVYVVSDIHNDADRFKLLLEKIDFAEDDILILAGDIFDRGNQPIELYFEILKHPNIQVIQGNHDVWLAREIMEKRSGRKRVP